jgi:glycosyltransferase involved in cell wall biosynthesis
MASLSVVLATFNEEKNISRCLQSVKGIASEIIIVDGTSTDKTVEISKTFGAKVEVTENHPIFHVNKQRAIDLAKSDWVLQLDADEEVSKALASEIKKVISMSDEEIAEYEKKLKNRNLFIRHQDLLEKRDGPIGEKEGHYVAFFFPRKNYFLGKYLTYGGVYPDGVIRLLKRGKAYLPAKDVHEQMVVKGRVGWLENDLLHYDSPTFGKYIMRWRRYTTLIAKDLQKDHKKTDVLLGLNFVLVKPLYWFLLTYIRHKGFLDSWQGFVFSFFSSLRFPKAYLTFLSL